MQNVQIGSLFTLEYTLAGEYLQNFCYPWEVLDDIPSFIERIGKGLSKREYDEISPQIWVHKSVKIAPSACLTAPCIIGANSEIRQCVFLRGGTLVGKDCVVGNSTELKNVILFDGVQVPHYNYVGDSILGYKAHMGAGAITSNVKGDKTFVTIQDGTQKICTNRKKVGAFLGDFVEVGCNSVLNPGTVVGKNTQIYPLSCVRGTVAENSIYKAHGEVVPKR